MAATVALKSPTRRLFPTSVLRQQIQETLTTHRGNPGVRAAITIPKRAGKGWVDTLDAELVTMPPAVEEGSLLLARYPPETVFDVEDSDDMDNRRTPIPDGILDSPRDVVRKMPKRPKFVPDALDIGNPTPSATPKLPDSGRFSVEIEKTILAPPRNNLFGPEGHMMEKPTIATVRNPTTPHRKARDIPQNDLEIEGIDSDSDFQVDAISFILPSPHVLTVFTSDRCSKQRTKFQEATAHLKPHSMGEIQASPETSSTDSTTWLTICVGVYPSHLRRNIAARR
jgi:hypothetical protein